MLTCTETNKKYIGQTNQTLEKRYQQHIQLAYSKSDKGKSALQFAIVKYGKDKFTKKIIFESDNEDILNDKEKEYIIQYNTLCPNGYNIQSGGKLNGKTHCSESREKMRLAKLGENNPNFGKPRTDQAKKNISLSKQGDNHHFFGQKLSYEHKLNLSLSHKKNSNTTDLPMYMVYLSARPEVYQSEGYAIINHPTKKKKYFTSKKIKLEEKYKLALDYLNN